MDERKTRVPLPQGGMGDGFDVQIEESTERWSEYVLADGTVMRVRPTLLQVIRLDGEHDPEGNPLYVTKIVPVMVVISAPEHLRKKVE